MYIFEINPLSVASFAVIFSQSEGCLFTLLIISFVVQKLLSFIKSHLFIFAFVSNILGCGFLKMDGIEVGQQCECTYATELYT